jgi:hypothetical protein
MCQIVSGFKKSGVPGRTSGYPAPDLQSNHDRYAFVIATDWSAATFVAEHKQNEEDSVK